MSDDDPAVIERIAYLEADMRWLKKKMESIERRQWEILAVIIITWLTSIIVAVLK